jgi:hypothetical protein
MPEQRLGEDVAAAVVLSQEASAQELDLREFVAHRLAEFKVPSRILILDEIPRTPIGKVKRIGLAERLGVTSSGVRVPSKYQAEFVAPRNALEARLADIWMQALGLPRVGVHDDFLSLGGDSILATQIIARVCEATQVAITIPRFLEAPTVAGLALAVTVAEAAQTDPEKLAQILDELNGLADGEAKRCPEGQA